MYWECQFKPVYYKLNTMGVTACAIQEYIYSFIYDNGVSIKVTYKSEGYNNSTVLKPDLNIIAEHFRILIQSLSRFLTTNMQYMHDLMIWLVQVDRG